MTIGKQIKARREQLGLTQEDLAKKMGYKSKTTINKIEMGINEVTTSNAAKFAKALGMTIPEIMGWEDDKAKPTPSHGVKIPVLGHVAAGIPIEAVENIVDYEEISQADAAKGEYFALRIKGDSMEPRISDGDVVIVLKQSDAESDQIVIALINGDDATCKRLLKYADGLALASFNPAYPPMIFSKKEVEEKPVRIIGRVVELRAKF